jgi:cytochrome c oxidase cbb3-type subunit 4
MDYVTARAFADTWGLLLLVVLFVGVLVFVFRRGSGARYRRAARIPMDAPESPAPPDRRIDEIRPAAPGGDRSEDAGRPAPRKKDGG